MLAPQANAGPSVLPQAGGFPGAPGLQMPGNNPLQDPRMAALLQMMRTPQGKDQLAGQLAPIGPPPAIPGAGNASANLVGQALGGFQKGTRPGVGMPLPILRRMPMTRGEAATNPPSIGGALSQAY